MSTEQSTRCLFIYLFIVNYAYVTRLFTCAPYIFRMKYTVSLLKYKRLNLGGDRSSAVVAEATNDMA
jgi:hypothetical protein